MTATPFGCRTMAESMPANILPFGKKAPPFERRRHNRVSTPNIRAHPSGAHVEILDMSQRGMAIETPHPFSVGGMYLFELFDDGRSLMIEGRVCWSDRIPLSVDRLEAGQMPTFRTGIYFVGVQNRSLQAAADALPPEALPVVGVDRGDEELTEDRIARLQTSTSPDESAELLLELLSADFEHLVLFRLDGEEIRAWLGRGPTLVPDRLMKLRLRLDQASIFLHLQQGGSFFYGMLPAMFAHLQILRCWNGSLQRECVLFPIRLRERLVAVLYADAGDHTLAPEHLASLKAATDLFTQSLIDQILRRKFNAAKPAE